MARGKTDVDQRPNTLKENKLVLCELRSRKIEHKSPHELNKLFGKFNSNNALRNSKNAKASFGTKQENVTEHPYGPIEGFPSGSWWGIRMDCSRDRVHEPFNKDIQDGPHGVVSLCTSHLSINNDVDLGDSLTITGNEYRSDAQSSHPLLQSYQNQLPLRLIRSYNLTNDFAPKTGYRYDGLYTVVSYWIGVSSATEKYQKFALVRLPHQEPPSWQLSTKISQKNVSRAKLSNAQTRCSGERFSTNICNDSHNTNEQQALNNLLSPSRTKSYSQKKSIVPNGPNIERFSDVKKSSHESTIVTRCTSKKTECFSAMVSVPYAETPILSYNRVLENSSNSAICKLQNTNISIRTDLYDSSNSLQQETRKMTPMTFCRTYNKTSRGPATRIVNHSNVVTLNLNSCGPCPRDSTQESLIQSRSGIGKFLAGQSPSSESNRSMDRSTPKSSTIQTESKTILDDHTINIPLMNEAVSGLGVEALNSARKEMPQGGIERKEVDGEKSREKTKFVQLSKEIEEKTHDEDKVGTVTGSNFKEVVTPSKNRNAANQDEISKEIQPDIDSLTPDQMLNFIVKQKYHPAAKLLIGRVIGLATAESTTLQVSDSLKSPKNPWTRGKTIDDEKNETTSMKKKNEIRTEEKNLPTVDSQDRDRDSGNKGCNKKPILWKNVAKRVLKEGKDRLMRSMRLGRTRVSKRLLGTDKKSSIKNARPSSSQHLQKSHLADMKKTQQVFSKSTIQKKSQKRAKKRRELANLVIDANIGPKVRGPRNRRLRCTTRIFTKKIHGKPDTSGRRAKSPEVGARAKKEIGREELSSRKSKRLISTAKLKIPQPRFAGTKKRVQETERMIVQRDYRPERTSLKIRSKSIETSKQSPIIRSSTGVKRKLLRSCSREQESGESRKRMCKNSIDRKSSENQVTRMIDAETQCTSRQDAATCPDPEIGRSENFENPQNIVKIECIDLDDVKSEMQDSDEEESTRCRSETQTFHEEAVRSREFVPIIPRVVDNFRINDGQRLSAFVPVNISDNDFRIARLRSIGFRPIEPADFPQEKGKIISDYEENFPGSNTEDLPENATVMSREVDELFNKYTSEESTEVGYMDQELRYQDIEDEVIVAARKSKNLKIDSGNPQRGAKRGRTPAVMGSKKIEPRKSDRVEMMKDRRVTRQSTEEDSEVPWHGWKKFVKNKQAQWIGW